MTHILSRLNHILAGMVAPCIMVYTGRRYCPSRWADLISSIGDPRVSMPLKDLSIEVARNPSTANTFNYASMAHNTHFYYQSLVR